VALLPLLLLLPLLPPLLLVCPMPPLVQLHKLLLMPLLVVQHLHRQQNKETPPL
jgi:hypothetical protein